MTDKQPQTCYVPLRDKELIEKGSKMCSVFFGSNTEEYESVRQLDSVYIHTPEELEALKAKWMREAAEKALHYAVENIDSELDPAPLLDTDVYLSIDITEYLDKNHPLKLNK